MTRLRICELSLIFSFCVAAGIASPAQSTYFTSVASFDSATTGYEPTTLVQATDGNFYGTTQAGGYGYGTVFEMTPQGMLTVLYSFGGPNGAAYPYGGLMQASDGNFYGTTYWGGPYAYGTVYKITPEGTLTTIYNFCSQPNCADGSEPEAVLVQGTDGNLYGTTSVGGAYGVGTIFKITPAGLLTTLHSFSGPDGINPVSGLARGTDGDFYGTTFYGGEFPSLGTAFKITPQGALTVLYSLDGSSGYWLYGPLVQAADGNFYGAASTGGAYGSGTVFKITSGGTLTTLHSFNGTDGAGPMAGLVQGKDGNFYGTTSIGGQNQDCAGGCGTVFKMTPGGTVTTLHSFDGTDGVFPFAGVVQASNGSFYGTTAEGGAYGSGTAFRVGEVHTCATCGQ